jgi:hypothetical protein
MDSPYGLSCVESCLSCTLRSVSFFKRSLETGSPIGSSNAIVDKGGFATCACAGGSICFAEFPRAPDLALHGETQSRCDK